MGRKKLRIPTKSNAFTSLAVSPLGQIMMHLQNRLQELIQKNKQRKEQSTLEKKYATQRLKDIKIILDKVIELFLSFDNGNQPSKLSLVKDGISLFSRLEDAKEFDTPVNVFYRITLERLHNAIKNSRPNTPRLTATNIPEFKNRLKKELRKETEKCYAEALQIPGCNLEHYFSIIEEVIDAFDLVEQEPFDVKDLEKRFIKEIKYALFDDKGYAPQALIISHPSMYHLVIELLDLLSQLPDELEDLVTFLNPKAFTLDIRNSALSAFIPDRFSDLKISVEHAPSNPQQTQGGQGCQGLKELRYKVTNNSGSEIYHNFQDYYNDFLVSTKNFLSYSLQTYLENYAQTPHVKSELAKMSLLQEFVEQEARLASSHLEEARQLHGAFDEFHTLLANERAPSVKVKLLHERMSSLDQTIAQLAYLLERNKDYELKKLNGLIATYPTLLNDLQRAKVQQLDVSYSTEQLPEVIIAFNEQTELDVVPVKDKLKLKNPEYEEIISLLSYFRSEKAKLADQLQQEVKVWQEQAVIRWKMENDGWISELNGLILEELDMPSDSGDVENIPIDKRLVVINELLLDVSARQKKAQHGLETVKSIEQNLAGSIQSFELLLTVAPVTNKELNACYEQSKMHVEHYRNRLQEAAANLEQWHEKLEIKRNKAKAAQELAETMKSSDPSVILSLRESKKRQLAFMESELAIQLVEEKSKKERHRDKVALLHLNSDPLANPDPLSTLEEEFFKKKNRFTSQCAEALQKIKLLLAHRKEYQTTHDPEFILSDENLKTSEGINTLVTWLGEITAEESNSRTEPSVPFKLKSELLPFCNLAKTLRTLSQDIEHFKNQRKQYAKEVQLLVEDIKQLSINTQVKQDELKDLTKEIAVLDKMVLLLVGNQEIGRQIAELDNLILEFNTIKLLNQHQEKLLSSLTAAREELSKLENLLKTAKIEAANNPVYEDNFNQIQKILAHSKEKLELLFNTICHKKQNDLDAFLIKIENEVKEIFSDENSDDSNLAGQLTTWNNRLTQCSVLSEKMKLYFLKIEFLQRDLSHVADEKRKAEITSKLDQFNELDKRVKTLYTESLAQVDSLLCKIDAELQQNQMCANLLFAESKASWETNVAVVEKVSRYLNAFPMVGLTLLKATLETLSSPPTESMQKIARLVEEFTQLNEKIGIKSTINSRLGKRIEEREEVVADFIAQLTRYEDERRKKYRYKDRLFPQDQQRRLSFIEKIIKALECYKDTGNSEALLTSICNEKETFHGFSLRSLLNRFVVKINELNKQIPDNYELNSSEDLKEANADLHEQAEAILNTLNSSDPELVTQIKKLYVEIGELEKFGDSIADNYKENANVAKKLAEALQGKVDQFLLDNQHKFTDKAASLSDKKFFTKFHMDFICHIHSRDEIMSQHTAWLPLLANIALASLAVFTLGLAIPAKQYITEVTTGEARFFCRTDGLSHVDAIEKRAENLIAAIA
ncbi:hypothetical protein [Legionella maceachernii]|uniref:Effector protein B, substrate of the Dot/Icm secretion system n=2 Tax=Legionella TaxID=445 RepID=A0A0W0VTV8_9GAMM|nr:hypothetical protein [Legionella maceachernii]KTD23503.1 effector protein B, substrate of the Dot/Icm secretion system [Legionella maceachernii]SJZ70178.1 hypothetical protein SAMN02745128_00838 [Legionella maceachernii]SUP02265.1 Uncharacterised protein [Legionella maceachernii]